MAALKAGAELWTGSAAEEGSVPFYSTMLVAALVFGLAAWWADKRFCSGPRILFHDSRKGDPPQDSQT